MIISIQSPFKLRGQVRIASKRSDGTYGDHTVCYLLFLVNLPRAEKTLNDFGADEEPFLQLTVSGSPYDVIVEMPSLENF